MEKSVAWTIGAGFDIDLGNTVALTPDIAYLASSGTTTTLNDLGVDYNLNRNMWQVGGALTIP